MVEALSTTTPAVDSLPLSDPSHMADALLCRALAACAATLALSDEAAVVDHLAQHDATVCRVCQEELAVCVAEYLSALDADITAIYRYTYACQPDGSPLDDALLTLPLYLVICTRRRTAALIALLAALDRALRQSLADRSRTHNVAPVLNVHVMDEADVRNQVGYAALLFAPRHEPDQVWKR